jgi:copper chaperone CopZ
MTLSMNLVNEKFNYLVREFRHETKEIIKNIKEKDGITHFQIDIDSGIDLIKIFYAGIQAGIDETYKSVK